MTRYFYRQLYHLFRNRVLRVAAIKGLNLLQLPYYRIGIDTNNLCNLRCIMCYLSLDDFRQKPVIMPLEKFEQLAQEMFAKIRFLDLSCAFEPFMTRNFIDYLRVARFYSKGRLAIATNGLLLTQEYIEAIFTEHLLDEIIISLDGISPGTYEGIRLGGDFQRLLEVLDWLKQAKAQFAGAVSLRINFTMMARNVNDLLGIYDFARKCSVDVVQLRHVRLPAEFKHLFHESLYYHQELANQALDKVTRDFAADPKKTLLAPPRFHGRPADNRAKARFAYPWFSFNIYSNGEVQMCDIGIVGNIMNGGLCQVEKSPRVREIRRRLLLGAGADFCRNCLFFTDILDVNDPASFLREDVRVLDTIQHQPQGTYLN
jgi:MoaA/NifB/PqqE/SkfB family radical SAM enzyme